MPMRGESLRFWVPVWSLVIFALYVSQQLVRAHVDPAVGSNNYTFDRDLPARRGSVYDAYGLGYPLAKSVSVWEYRLDPVALTNRVVRHAKELPRERNAILKTIAHALGLDYRKVVAMADRTGGPGWRSQFLAVSSNPDSHRILADSTLVSGVAIEDRQVRQYIHGRRFAHVLGSVNAEHVGSAGIEQRFNAELTGVPGKIHGMKDARGHEIYDKREVSIDPVPGADVFLTVDHNIQYEVEQALQEGVKEYGAGSGWCVVLDAATGAVLAMASVPDFDPVVYGRTTAAQQMNRAVAVNYEPGSVMKVITAAIAVDAGIVRPTSTYSTDRNDERYYRLPGDKGHVWDERMSVCDAIVHSSNIVIGKLGFDLGPERLWKGMRAFGFGEKTGVELPGEQYGILPFWKKWDKVKWSRAPIGQGVSVTAMQLVSAYQAIANDGVRMRPHIVSKVIGSDGSELYSHSDERLGRPISAETARQVRSMMLGVASRNGTARRAAIRGYSVAGKTGTAQKVINGRYADNLFRASFCGIVPSGVVQVQPSGDEILVPPRFVALVTLDFDVPAKYHQGGNSAAPIFRRIALAALRYLMVTPDRPDELSDFEEEDDFDRILETRARACGTLGRGQGEPPGGDSRFGNP